MNHTLIRHCRHFSGLSQSEIAARLGVTQSNISKYEAGTLKPTPKMFRKLKEVFAENGIGAEEIQFLKEIFAHKK